MTISLVLKIILILYLLQGVAKFAVHFLVPYDTRIRKIGDYYRKDARTIRLFDDITLAAMIVFVGALLVSGAMEWFNFASGLVVGMTLIQLYVHRFLGELPPDKMPEPPVWPSKLLSFAIQARPQNAWREYLLMGVLLLTSAAVLITQL